MCVRNRPPRSLSRERRGSATRPLSNSRDSSRRSSVSSVQSNMSSERGVGSRGRRLAWESPQNTSGCAKRTSSKSKLNPHIRLANSFLVHVLFFKRTISLRVIYSVVLAASLSSVLWASCPQ